MTKLHMEKLVNNPNKDFTGHNNMVAYKILKNHIQKYASNTLIVLHGPNQSGKSAITNRLTSNIISSTDDYLKTIRTTTCYEKHFVDSFVRRYNNEPLLIIVKDSVNLQDIQHYFDLLDDSKNKNRPPITIVLELKTP